LSLVLSLSVLSSGCMLEEAEETYDITSEALTPYAGAVALPGTVNAEKFDLGGEGAAYHDDEPANLGGAMRTSEGVDIAYSSNAGYHVGWLDVGDWMKYTVSVAQAGSYQVKLRYAASNPPAAPRAKVSFSGNGASTTLTMANTGGWDSWTTTQATVTLAAGTQVMTVESVVDYWNLNDVVVEQVATSAGIVRTAWKPTASSSYSGQPPSYAIDGSTATRWSTGVAMTAGQWFQVDMGGCYAVDKVVMDSGSSGGDYARGYKIYVSDDGTNWGSSVASASPTSSPVTATFSPKSGRHFKIVQTGSSGSWWSLHDLRAYGAPSTSCAATPPGSGGTLRVVSWNIHGMDDAGPSSLAQKLAAQNPDVVLLQEVPSTQGENLRTQLASQTSATWIRGSLWGVEVMTKKPVLAGPDTRDIGANSWCCTNRAAVRIRIDVGGVPVDVFGTHLDWNPNGVMTNHIANRTAFLDWVDSFSGLQVAGGDLNAWTWGGDTTEGNEQRNTIAAFDARLADTCSSVRGGHDTCNGDATQDNNWRPDYVYRSTNIAAVSYQVVPHAGLSDHDLVVTQMTVPAQ
jgi:endonuclease/exonuclease/phosphatase family metal-dependent hydrolase